MDTRGQTFWHVIRLESQVDLILVVSVQNSVIEARYFDINFNFRRILTKNSRLVRVDKFFLCSLGL